MAAPGLHQLLEQGRKMQPDAEAYSELTGEDAYYMCFAGRQHDSDIWQETRADYPTEPGEWGLGDLAYGSCTRLFTGRKRPSAGSRRLPWTQQDEYTKNLIAHYRARVESVIHRIKRGAWSKAIFRGNKDLFDALFHTAVYMTALKIKNEFELDGKLMFECVGPWPHKFY